jgi:hypothetical protein
MLPVAGKIRKKRQIEEGNKERKSRIFKFKYKLSFRSSGNFLADREGAAIPHYRYQAQSNRISLYPVKNRPASNENVSDIYYPLRN